MTDEQWYWDLAKRKAVRASERGPGDETLGPYSSKAGAENWRSTVEARNAEWDDDDAEWSGTEQPNDAGADWDPDDPSQDRIDQPGPTS